MRYETAQHRDELTYDHIGLFIPIYAHPAANMVCHAGNV
jgi:hypothetical protein